MEGLPALGFYRDGGVVLGAVKDEGFEPKGDAGEEVEAFLQVASDPSTFQGELEELAESFGSWKARVEALLVEGKPTGVSQEFRLNPSPGPLTACVSIALREVPGIVEHYALYGLLSDVALKEGAHGLHPVGTGFSLLISGEREETLLLRAIPLASLLREVARRVGLPEITFGIALGDTRQLRPGLFISPAEDMALFLALSCQGELVGLASVGFLGA